MFLDDGISRKSAPNHKFLFRGADHDHLAGLTSDVDADDNEENSLWDAEAENEFTHVIIKQVNILSPSWRLVLRLMTLSDYSKIRGP
jgi:hypothetical protein